MPTAPWKRHEDSAFEEREDESEASFEEFDRVEFTMSALELVCPPRMTVAVCTGRSKLRVEAGRAWGRGDGARWAMVCVPPTVSREAIVLALTELSGGQPLPYTLDVLVARARAPRRTRDDG